MKPTLAAVLGLVPQTAWAHGDHAGWDGVKHVLSSPDHLIALLLVGTGFALVSIWRKRGPERGGWRWGQDPA